MQICEISPQVEFCVPSGKEFWSLGFKYFSPRAHADQPKFDGGPTHLIALATAEHRGMSVLRSPDGGVYIQAAYTYIYPSRKGLGLPVLWTGG